MAKCAECPLSVEEVERILSSDECKKVEAIFDDERLDALCDLTKDMLDAGHAADVVFSIMLPAAFKIGYDKGRKV